MGKSRHRKHYQKYDYEEEEDYSDKFKNRRQSRLKKLHDREEIEEDDDFQLSQ